MSIVPTFALPDPLATLDVAGSLHSARFNERYHAHTGAFVRASRVFLAGAHVRARWRSRDRYTVADIGFGAGTNFLALWDAWRQDAHRPRTLHVVAFEAYPLPSTSLRQSLTVLTPLALLGLADALWAQWPPRLPGIHRLEFEGGRVTLTLVFGDIRATARDVQAEVDAYFLDGFSPIRNPEMWSADVLQTLTRLATPQATVATWVTERGVLGALAAAGFAAEIAGADGGPMLTRGRFVGESRPPVPVAPDHALVIGGGIAGAGIAQALALRGMGVTVVDAHAVGPHAGHRAAALTPLISRDDDLRARLSRAGSSRALARWLNLPGDAAPQRCGTVQLARDDAHVAVMAETVQRLGFPSDWVRAVDRAEASDLAGLPLARGGVYFAAGLRIDPQALIDGLVQTQGVRRVTAAISRLSRAADGAWCAHGADDAVVATAPLVVVAAAADAPRLLAPFSRGCPSLSAMHALAGEVSFLSAEGLQGGPRCIVGGQGYLLPAAHGYCVAGSTYAHGAVTSDLTTAGREVNLGKVRGLLGAGQMDRMWALEEGGAVCDPGMDGDRGWAGWRAVLPGRLPAIGELDDFAGLWLATGYASRGLSWSALAGDLISSRLFGEPSPLETGLQDAIAPR